MGHTRPSALYSGFHLSEETYRFLSRSARLCRKRSAYSGLPSFSLHSSANRCREGESVQMEHATLLLLVFIADALIGDPPWLPHPIRLIGKAINRGEQW